MVGPPGTHATVTPRPEYYKKLYIGLKINLETTIIAECHSMVIINVTNRKLFPILKCFNVQCLLPWGPMVVSVLEDVQKVQQDCLAPCATGDWALKGLFSKWPNSSLKWSCWWPRVKSMATTTSSLALKIHLNKSPLVQNYGHAQALKTSGAGGER